MQYCLLTRYINYYLKQVSLGKVKLPLRICVISSDFYTPNLVNGSVSSIMFPITGNGMLLIGLNFAIKSNVRMMLMFPCALTLESGPLRLKLSKFIVSLFNSNGSSNSLKTNASEGMGILKFFDLHLFFKNADLTYFILLT